MTNLRPRIQEFNPFRKTETPGGGGADTFVRQDVDRTAENNAQSLLNAVRGLAPSVGKFLDRSQEAFTNRLQAEADAEVDGLTPEQIRSESIDEWERHSKDSGIDNAWWKIILDESAGRRVARDFSAGLVERSQEATNPADPNAHFRILEEEKAKASDGLGHFAMLQFNKSTEATVSRQARVWAEQREARVQAQQEDSYRGELRGMVVEALNPANGGTYDTTEIMALVQGEFARSGNPGRADVLEAVKDSLTNQIAEAHSDEDLEAIGTQFDSLMADLADEEFGPNNQTLEDLAGLELDTLSQEQENMLEARRDIITQKELVARNTARLEMGDITAGVTVSFVDGEMTVEEAHGKLLEEATRLGKEHGVDPQSLYGVGRLTMASTQNTIAEAQFSHRDDALTVNHLDEILTAPGFDPSSFAIVLEGAVTDGKITENTYKEYLGFTGDKALRVFQSTAATHVKSEIAQATTRLLEVDAKPFLSQIPDGRERARATAYLTREMDAFEIRERKILTNLLRESGAGNELGGVESWTNGYNDRLEHFLVKTMNEARSGLGSSVSYDAKGLFRENVRGAESFGPAQRHFVYQGVLEEFKGRDDDALDILAEVSGSGMLDFSNPVGDLAAWVASKQASGRSGTALELFNKYETAFLDTLYENADIDSEGVDVTAATRNAIKQMESREVEVPDFDPKELPPKDNEEVKTKALVLAGPQAVAAHDAQAGILAASDALIAFDADSEGSTYREPETRKRLEKELTHATAVFDAERLDAYNQHRGVLDAIGAGFATDYYQGRSYSREGDRRWGVTFENGRIKLKNPPSLNAKVVGKRDGHVRPGEGEVDGVEANKIVASLEREFNIAKMWTGVTLSELREGKARPYENAPKDKWVNLDMKLISPASTPFFESIEHLEGMHPGSIKKYTALFPGWTSKDFIEAQRLIILERIPDTEKEKLLGRNRGKK